MHGPENFASSDFLQTETRSASLIAYRMPEQMTILPNCSARNESTMVAYDRGNDFSLYDSEEESGRGESVNDGAFEPGFEKDESINDEKERGEDDVRWAKALHAANENNAESKDLKESLGRVKPNELTAIFNELKNLKHEEARQILKERFDKMAGSDNGINTQELANQFEESKDPKVRAACIYATRYFDEFAQAANLLTRDWSGPVIERADLDKAKKPGH